ncbi:MAG TPA: MerR family DNA-binding transcriptional regulator [Rhodanobacteraceae bacterium]|jgi:DNA-binding transcriptional MerR regulator|nr:MerR family DNA-binding transcriptional regulator [Rhodanobacteraceae bacterium]
MTERTIGQLAHEAGVGIETIRYYQRIGLIPKPQRTFNGWGRYPDRTLQLLHYLREGRQLGFTLRELGDLFSQSSAGAPRFCMAFRAAVETKVAELDIEMERLQAHRAQLCDFAKSCKEREHSGQCPMLDRLS